MSKILVIDDEQAILENLKFVLELEDYEVLTASGGEEGITIFNTHKENIDAVLTDMKMPRFSGMNVLKAVKKIMPEMSVIVLTGHGDMENAILAMKEGAFEYLMKPVNADILNIAVKNAVVRKKLLEDNFILQKKILDTNLYLQYIHDSAQKILLNMLPQKMPEIDGFAFSSVYRCCDSVGGDMFDALDIGEYLCFYVFDVSSHGILASVITIILKSFIQNIKYNFIHGIKYANFSTLIADLNQVMNLNTARDTFATMFIGFIEKSTHKLYYISAGHITQYIFNVNEIIPLESTGTILGVFEDADYATSEIQLKQGDKIILFTDGVTEISCNDVMFGESNILKILMEQKPQPIGDVLNCIMEEITVFSKGEFSDDTTMLGIEVK